MTATKVKTPRYRCPGCNKFCRTEVGDPDDPEVNDGSEAHIEIGIDVYLYSACCGEQVACQHLILVGNIDPLEWEPL